jgi:hypothetical protein
VTAGFSENVGKPAYYDTVTSLRNEIKIVYKPITDMGRK